VRRSLLPAVEQGLVVPVESQYRFVHDRVREAAYLLLPEQARAEAHRRIARRLLAGGPPAGDAIFDVVGHLNLASSSITGDGERRDAAAPDLAAGRRALATQAHASALGYSAPASPSWSRWRGPSRAASRPACQ
jgi:predicted ATPase